MGKLIEREISVEPGLNPLEKLVNTVEKLTMDSSRGLIIPRLEPHLIYLHNEAAAYLADNKGIDRNSENIKQMRKLVVRELFHRLV